MTNLGGISALEKTVIFVHLPKCAGSTLNRILLRQYKLSETYALAGRSVRDSFLELKRLPEEKKGGIRLLYGHMHFGLHEHLPQPCVYFTLLRDPVERVISH